MGSKQIGMGLYEFLIESELQHYYNAIKNDLKVQSVSQLKYVTDDDLNQIGMARPEVRRLKKFFQKHYPQTYLAKMKKKLLYRRDDAISVASLSSYAPNTPGRMDRSVAPGRHIIQAESIVIHKTLGSGEFGTVQQGVWTSDDGQRTQVAIKCLSQERMENNPVEFLKEAAIMHNVDHEHIVRLYGVVLDTSALMLVTELAPLRSLLECLKEPSMRRNLSVLTLYDFAVQICDGMQYLESKRLIHRDLAARNILVFSRSKVKISDFGLSRALGVGKDYYQTNFNVNLKLPIAWCAPECINFLRFTSSSDVWAYGVTLWEMFSYGFQPWAALTGQQILEAIDEPNYQRLERPECCPNEIYCQIMLKCWQHDPLNRPSFAQLSNLILECKPEQLQAIRESDPKPRRDFLIYDVGDIITVLEKKPQQSSDDVILWKGVLKDGKTGLFQAVNTITYLGSSLPSVKPSQSPFHRNDSRSSSMRKGRISADMISGPQGDLKHTGHVGPDGQFFGDITFLGSKCWVPRQVVPPYKPETNEPSGSTGRAVPQSSSRSLKESTTSENSSDTVPLLATASFINDDGSNKGSTSSSSGLKRKPITVSIPGINYNTGQDHEYHEISDEENEIMEAMGSCLASTIGVSNPALSSKSQSPLDSPRFEKSFDLETGPSLVDEVFGALQQDAHGQPDEAHNVKNELREMARAKKKFASVKPISSSDRRTLDHAIAIANELATRSMLDLDRSGKHPSFDDISSPRTPNSPSHRSKFSFILGSGKNDRERRNYSQEAASIPDIQSTLTDEAKEAYNSLVEKPSMNALGFLTPSFENKSMSFHFPEKCSSLSKKSDLFQPEPTTGPQSLTEISAKANSSLDPACNITSFPGKSHSRSLSKSEAEDLATPNSLFQTQKHNEYNEEEEPDEEEEEVDGNPLRLLRQNKQAMLTNVLPLPPRKGAGQSAPTVRHQRKHPLLIPTRISSLTSSSVATSNTVSDLRNNESTSSGTKASPPPPPPKPLRQNLASESLKKATDENSEKEISPFSKSLAQKDMETPSDTEMSKGSEAYFKDIRSVSSIVQSISSNESKRSSMDSVLLYENVLEGNCSSEKDTEPSANDVASSNTSSTVNSQDCLPQEDVPTILPSSTNTSTNNTNTNRLSSSESSYASFNSSTSNNSRIRGSTSSATSSSSRIAPVVSQQFGSVGAFSNDEYYPTSMVSEKSHSRQSSLSLGEPAITAQSSTVEPVPKPRTSTANNVKIKTLQRILGPSTSEEDCGWALDATDSDAAHAVKLLRLKSLLPETLITADASNLVSVLEMSHWDVARASDFLLANKPSTTQRGSSSMRGKLMRHGMNTGSFSNYESVLANVNPDSMNNNSSSSDVPENNSDGTTGRRSYIRPTHV